MYIYLNVWQQLIDVKLLLLHSNTWNHLTMNRIISACLEYLKSFNSVQKN